METGDTLSQKGLEDLWFIGEVGGIYYYADSGLKNWTDARAFCVEYGLHLSIITTNDQWNLLAAAFNTTAFSGNHWTALRDAYLPRQFSWDNLGTEPSSDIGMVWGNSDGNGNGEYQTCASFYASSIANTAIYINPCSSYFKVLCET
ncbi:C-type lectin domain family 4 member F [Orchesella cincta]|uniref:C-type lectin domain family 4 member F n=1 Tax=Orchesella cincta TaxID=48709 RepID=A0A1D2M7M1_ORCCI|nr:C-type lectin domain family 4 member F [Orchesella cincta]